MRSEMDNINSNARSQDEVECYVPEMIATPMPTVMEELPEYDREVAQIGTTAIEQGQEPMEQDSPARSASSVNRSGSTETDPQDQTGHGRIRGNGSRSIRMDGRCAPRTADGLRK